jgi:hypothetical protein
MTMRGPRLGRLELGERRGLLLFFFVGRWSRGHAIGNLQTLSPLPLPLFSVPVVVPAELGSSASTRMASLFKRSLSLHTWRLRLGTCLEYHI